VKILYRAWQYCKDSTVQEGMLEDTVSFAWGGLWKGITFLALFSKGKKTSRGAGSILIFFSFANSNSCYIITTFRNSPMQYRILLILTAISYSPHTHCNIVFSSYSLVSQLNFCACTLFRVSYRYS